MQITLLILTLCLSGQARINPDALPKETSLRAAQILSKQARLTRRAELAKIKQKSHLKAKRLAAVQRRAHSKLLDYLMKKDRNAYNGLKKILKKKARLKPYELSRDSEVRAWAKRVSSYQAAAVLEKKINLGRVRSGVKYIVDQEACDGLRSWFESQDQPMASIEICEPSFGVISQPSSGSSGSFGSEESEEESSSEEPQVIIIEPQYAEAFATSGAEASESGFLRAESSQVSILLGMPHLAQINNFFTDPIGNRQVEVKATVEILGGEQSAWVTVGSATAETFLSLVVAEDLDSPTECSATIVLSSLSASAGLFPAVVGPDDLETTTFELSCEFTTGSAGSTYMLQNNLVASAFAISATSSVSTSASVRINKIELKFLD